MAGKGTFGKVFKARKKDSGKIYAMKVLQKDFLIKRNYLKYAITECNVLKQNSSPYVIKMHYAFQTPDYLYMILDFCAGGDLAYHLKQRSLFEENEARFFIAEIIMAIEFLHDQNILYRDLKPENVLIDD